MKINIGTISKFIPVIFSILLISAHFYRARNPVLMFICLAVPLILFIRKPIAARIMQAFFVLASIEWIRTTFYYVSVRSDLDQPWIRLTFILGFLAVFTFSTALVFYTAPLKELYKWRQQ